jgi:hypothetical protein
MPATTPLSSPWTWPTPARRSWSGCGQTAAFTRIRCPGRLPLGPAAPPRHQTRLRRPWDLADPDRHPDLHRRPVRHRHRGRVGGAAPQAATPLRPRHPGPAADPARHAHPRAGPARPTKTQPPKVLWLWWASQDPVDVDLAWRAYVRWFDIEHTVRFAKQTLGWTTPRPRRPQEADRWTWWSWPPTPNCAWPAASGPISGYRGSGPSQPQLSPCRVRRGFPRLLSALGSPAAMPKPCGRSPGRAKGRRSGPATRYPAVKKTSSKTSEPATAA